MDIPTFLIQLIEYQRVIKICYISNFYFYHIQILRFQLKNVYFLQKNLGFYIYDS